MDLRPTLAIMLCAGCLAVSAQVTTILSEDFESGSLFPMWPHNGNQPVFTPGNMSMYAISKESPDQSNPPLPPPFRSMIFYPVTHNPNLTYYVGMNVKVDDPFGNNCIARFRLGFFDFITPDYLGVAGNGLGPATGWVYLSAQGNSPPPPPTGNYHFGVMLYMEQGTTGCTGHFDNITILSSPNSNFCPEDVSGDGLVKYTGAGNDRDLILQFIGGSIPTNVVPCSGCPEDINGDGVVKYTGANNDRDLILQLIGGSIPTNVHTCPQ